MTIVEIRPRTEADLNKPAVEVLGKGDRWLIPDFEKWLNSDEGKALAEYREQRKASGGSTAPYGPIWDALKNPHRHKNHPSRQFLFDWDYRHAGEIEVKDRRRGAHIGVIDPITGEWLKPRNSNHGLSKQ